jgi:hypothetical protein
LSLIITSDVGRQQQPEQVFFFLYRHKEKETDGADALKPANRSPARRGLSALLSGRPAVDI